MRPREGAAREAFDRKGRAHYLRRRVQTLPAFIRKRFSLRLESLERRDPKEAVRWLFGTFERHVLRRVDAVNAQYLPQSNCRRSFPCVMIFICCRGQTKSA
jgi:hypothetical protein